MSVRTALGAIRFGIRDESRPERVAWRTITGMNSDTPQGMSGRRVVVVGGVAGGMSTATRLRRLDPDASIVVLERSGHV